TNVNVIWEQTTFETQSERFNIILASQDLPDMFWNLNNRQGAMTALRAANAIIPLQKYLTPQSAPNFRKVVTDHPETVKAFMEPDGNVWFLPLFDGLAANDPTIVRGDWLEKLNLPLPVTKDDWLKYWKGVRDNDVNGKGKGSAIPLAATSSIGFQSWVTLFGMIDGFFVDVKDGNKVKYSYIDPRNKDFLAWGNMLWNENILDREFASITSNGFTQKNSQNLIGSYRGKLNGGFNVYMATLPANIPGYKVYGTEPPKADDGTQLHWGTANFVRYDTIGGVVSAKTKYPSECVQYCDWFYNFDAPYGGGFMNIFGLEGVTFNFTADKKDYNYSDYVLKNPNGLSTTSALLRYTNRNQQPGFVPPIGSFKMWNPLTEQAYKRIEPFYKASLAYRCENLPFTDAENKQIRTTMADIQTYVDETVNRFIMGKEPLANFDSFVAKVKSMGIDDVLKIYNSAYAKWNAPRPNF
ncbi:MAG: hypothetical protein FWC45_00625, partial [Treponema sp.]|nr:hypothetical protein [Treponema sp.]